MFSHRWKEILRLAWPLIIANSFWNLQFTIDRVFLARHSTEALGAAMAVMGVFWVPMALLQQTAAYVTTFVAQYRGAGQEKNVGGAVWQAVHVSWVGGLGMVGLNFFSAPFFAWVGHSPAVQAQEVAYYNAVSYSALPTALLAVCSGFFTGVGQTRTVAVINFVGLAVNALLDPLFIFGKGGFPAWGAAGAGYATAVGNWAAAGVGFFLMLRGPGAETFGLRLHRSPDRELLKKFLRFGLPSGMQWALEGLAFTAFLVIMGRLKEGEASLAASSIAVTVMMLSVLPSLGVAQAVMTCVGRSMGEHRPDEAARYVWTGVKISSIYMACAGLSFALVPGFYLSWFENHSALWERVSYITPILLKIVALFTVLDSVYLNISFGLKGAGDTRFVSLLALIVPWPVMVAPTYWVRGWDNAVYVAWGFAALYSLCISSLLMARFRAGRWKTLQII